MATQKPGADRNSTNLTLSERKDIDDVNGKSSESGTQARDDQRFSSQSSTIKNSGSKSDTQDAVSLLKKDHQEVLDAFKKFKSEQSEDAKSRLVEKICSDLIVHAKLEEEIFYPACREQEDDPEMLNEAQVEHDTAKVLIHELQTLSRGSEYFDAKVNVLAELIKHHIAEEEKAGDGIFAKAQAGGVDLKELGQRLQHRKAELMSDTGRRIQRDDFVTIKLSFASTHPSSQEMQPMASQYYEGRGRGSERSASGNRRERDEYGRFTNEDDDNQYRPSRQESGQYGEDSRYGRSDRDFGPYSGQQRSDRYGRGSNQYDYEDDRRGFRGRGGEPERDEYGRFMSDEDNGRYSSQDDDRGYYSSGREDEERGSYSSRGGRREWDDELSSQSRGRGYDEDDRRYGSMGGNQGRDQGRGWFGDSEGHSRAAQERGNERGGRSSSRERGDEDESRRSGSRGQGHGGWFGDSRRHAQAARRGWQNR